MLTHEQIDTLKMGDALIVTNGDEPKWFTTYAASMAKRPGMPIPEWNLKTGDKVIVHWAAKRTTVHVYKDENGKDVTEIVDLSNLREDQRFIVVITPDKKRRSLTADHFGLPVAVKPLANLGW